MEMQKSGEARKVFCAILRQIDSMGKGHRAWGSMSKKLVHRSAQSNKKNKASASWPKQLFPKPRRLQRYLGKPGHNQGGGEFKKGQFANSEKGEKNQSRRVVAKRNLEDRAAKIGKKKSDNQRSNLIAIAKGKRQSCRHGGR